MTVIDEIKKLLTTSDVLIGAEQTLKGLRKSAVGKVFVATNVKESILTDISNLAKMQGVEIVEVGIPNDDLGTVCKKPFSISVIGMKKQ